MCCLSLQKDAVDIKLLVCIPNAPLHADIFLLGRAVSKVSCGCLALQRFQHGCKLAYSCVHVAHAPGMTGRDWAGLKVPQEARLTGILLVVLEYSSARVYYTLAKSAVLLSRTMCDQ